MISSISTQAGSFSNYYQLDNSDKIEIPVPSSQSVYAQFKYVRGVPASSDQQPVSISKAQIIDNMVSYLNSSSDDMNLNKSEEYTVQELEGEVHRVVNEESTGFNSLPGRGADTGLIFNLTA